MATVLIESMIAKKSDLTEMYGIVDGVMLRPDEEMSCKGGAFAGHCLSVFNIAVISPQLLGKMPQPVTIDLNPISAQAW